MSLSVREKVLVFLLIIAALIFVGVKYLISPVQLSGQNNKNKIIDLFTQQQVVAQKVAVVRAADSNLQKQLASANSAAAAILPQPENELINVWAVNLAQKSGLVVTTISLSKPAVTDIGTKTGGGGTSQAGQTQTDNYLLKDYMNTYKNGSEKGSTASSSAPSTSASSATASGSSSATLEGGLLCISVSINLTGTTFNQCQAFLDDVKNCGKTAIITTYSCAQDTTGHYIVSAIIDCYGAEKLNDSDTTFAWSLPKPSGESSLMK